MWLRSASVHRALGVWSRQPCVSSARLFSTLPEAQPKTPRSGVAKRVEGVKVPRSAEVAKRTEGFKVPRSAEVAKRTEGANTPSAEELRLSVTNPRILRKYMDPSLSVEDYFQLEHLVTIEDMFNARLHYGHKIGTLEDNMKWALYGERLGVCIFDLDITRRYLLRAMKFLAHLASMDPVILFITTQRSQILLVEEVSERLGQYSHCRKWDYWPFANAKDVYGTDIRLPDAVIFLNTLSSVMEQHPAVIECAKMNIPSVGIVDSNAQPNYITYVVPGNDDSFDSCSYYLKMFAHAIKAGQRKAKEQQGGGARSQPPRGSAAGGGEEGAGSSTQAAEISKVASVAFVKGASASIPAARGGRR